MSRLRSVFDTGAARLTQDMLLNEENIHKQKEEEVNKFTMEDVVRLADEGRISDSLYACLLIADMQWRARNAA